MKPFVFILLVAGGTISLCQADPISLASASNYAVLGLTNSQITQSGSGGVITGNEGIAAGGKIQDASPAIVNGNVVEAATGAYSGATAQIHGSLIQNYGMLNTNYNDAMTAYQNAIAMSPTQTFVGGINATNSAQTITGNGGTNVIYINGNLNLNGATLTLTGTASDVFIVVVSGNLSISGNNAGLLVSGGVTSSQVLYVFDGKSGSITTHNNKENVFGTILAPNYSLNLQGTSFNGAIISGGKMQFNGAVVNYSPFNAPAPTAPTVPEPATYLLSGLGIIALIGFARFYRHRNAA
jgi:hypothetical protein